MLFSGLEIVDRFYNAENFCRILDFIDNFLHWFVCHRALIQG